MKRVIGRPARGHRSRIYISLGRVQSSQTFHPLHSHRLPLPPEEYHSLDKSVFFLKPHFAA